MLAFRLIMAIGLLLLTACGSSSIPTEVKPTTSVPEAPTATTTPATTRVVEPTIPPPLAPTAVPTSTPPLIADTRVTVIRPDDERINYIGRFDFQDPLRPSFDWSASTIAFRFSGTGAAMLLADGRNSYNIYVDGVQSLLETEIGRESYLLAENLAAGEHSVRVTKRNEAYVGAAQLKGLQITGGGLLDLPAAKARHIEFIGDSITTGYGNEGDSPDCFFTAQTQNAERTYAAMTADQLESTYSLVALSGLGVVRNLRDADSESALTAIDFVDRALGMNAFVRWPADAAAPQAVVINLGTNDFSSTPFPESDLFVEAYVNLLQRLRQRSPNAHLFAVSGPLMLQPAPRLIETAVARFSDANNDTAVTYVPINDNLERSAVDFGCDWHPNVSGHEKISAQLAPVMKRVMQW